MAETVLGEAPIDTRRLARFVLTAEGLRVRMVNSATGAVLVDQPLEPTVAAVRKVMAATLALRDRIFDGGRTEGALYLLDTDGSVTRASPDRLDSLAEAIVEEAQRELGARRDNRRGRWKNQKQRA